MNKKPWIDPIVSEVRENREKLLSESEYDLDIYFDKIKAEEECLVEKGVRYVTFPPKNLKAKDAA